MTSPKIDPAMSALAKRTAAQFRADLAAAEAGIDLDDRTQLYGATGTVFGEPRAEPATEAAPELGRYQAGGPPESVVATTWPGEVARLTRDLAAMSERCHRAELALDDSQRAAASGLLVIQTGHALIHQLKARVCELEADLAAIQQARVAEALDRVSRTITGRPAAEVSAELTEQLRGDPDPIDGPERFRDDDEDQTVVVDVAEWQRAEQVGPLPRGGWQEKTAAIINAGMRKPPGTV